MTVMTVVPPIAPRSDLRWAIRTSVPPGWRDALERCGGGFFHAPPGLLAGAPAGQPIFLELWHGGEVTGVAAGVRHRCRLSARPQHVYLPTMPALRDPAARVDALASLRATLRAEGADEIVFDSFDAAWSPRSLVPGSEPIRRKEYLVPLEQSAAAIAARCVANHRRQCSKGARLAWTIRPVHGLEATTLLALVQRTASDRAASRGDAFLAELPPSESLAETAVDAPWGMTALAGWDGDTPLAAVVIGWANRRAFYVAGGSTPAGYARGASVWLHWRIMSDFAARGFKTYNLGGTPLSADLAEDPAHGLQRFKSGFGAEIVEQCGVRWEFQSAHLRAHRVKGWMSRTYRAWRQRKEGVA